MQTQAKIIFAGICLIIMIGASVLMFDVVRIRGNEIGVMETWTAGVMEESLTPKTYFCLPWKKIVKYPTSVQIFVMNDRGEEEQGGEGRKQDSYLVQSTDNQDMHLSLQVQWRIDPAHVVTIHKTVGPDNIEEKILRPTMLRVVKDEATTREAIEAYSGQGLVDLQQSIEKDLNDPNGELRERGIIVDSFVIEHIRLDEDYVAEIKARQVAVQKEQRAIQEEKAAQAEALKAKAVAQADLNRAVVQAERDKQVMILAAEAENQKKILEAEANKKQTVLAAEAKKESGELEAAAILAIGTATAEAKKLEFLAYGSEGADIYAKIEIARAMKDAFSNIKGYLPESMNVYTLGDNFMKAVENVVRGQQTITQQ